MQNKKIIAFYLPQFHSIPENDEWWGKGFTEWSNTKKAKPLYRGHIQPKIPLKENYYNLLDEKVQLWQAKIAQKYGVYGFCYYHYWFNGKLLLEKPMENMLNNLKINIPFCISWANESWARTWDGKEKNILIQQKYEGETDWEAHINYLIPFFKDERYIKINNKPVFLLYTASRIENCEKMIKYWNERLQKEGFSGIYIIETLNGLQHKSVLNSSSAEVIFEPIFSRTYDYKEQTILSKIKRYLRSNFGIGNVEKIDILKIYQLIENRKYNSNKKIYAGTFPSWDNTARKGKRGWVFFNGSPDTWKKHLGVMYKREDIGEFIFVNAWNEWGEGAYLEPDEIYKYSYLEKIRDLNDEAKVNKD